MMSPLPTKQCGWEELSLHPASVVVEMFLVEMSEEDDPTGDPKRIGKGGETCECYIFVADALTGEIDVVSEGDGQR